MKINLPAFVVPALSGLLLFTNCSKSSKAPTVISNYTGTISVTAGTTDFKSTQLINATDIGGVMYLAGKQILAGDSAAVQINFPDTLNANGTYNDTTGKLFTFTYYDSQKGVSYRSGFGQPSGTITIVSFSTSAHAIVGNFSAVVYPGGNPSQTPLKLTSGTFSATYVPH